ncbi:MAG: HD domain-containing protein [Kiloniellales bacterium]
MNENPVIDRLSVLYQDRGSALYLGEPVTIAQHMLQTAALAEREEAPAPLVAAALLHDIGHLVDNKAAESDWDRVHDRIGAAFLAHWFPPEVVEPIRLHVQAKRYLCAAEPDYFGRLSAASVHTLGLQGGPMTTDELARFEAEPGFEAALRVRRWDEGGKDVDCAVPGFDHYRPLLAGLLQS